MDNKNKQLLCNESTPSLLLYGIMILISVMLILISFMIHSNVDGLLLNLASSLISSVIILLAIDKKYRKSEIIYLRGIPNNIGNFISFLGFNRYEIRKYLIKSGARFQGINDKYMISRAELENQVYQKKDSFILIGTAGSGKTVLLIKLFMYKIKQALQSPQKKIIVPVYLNLGYWNVNLEESLLDSLQKHSKISRRTLRKLIQRGNLVCILDGLDEVMQNEPIINEIANFHNNFPETQIILSTRPLNIVNALDFPILEMPHYTEDELSTIRQRIHEATATNID